MSRNQRKIAGPVASTPYILFTDKLNKPAKLKKRRDGRKDDEQRQIYVKLGVTSQAKGSAYLEMGQTKVIVSVLDPREIPKQNRKSLDGEIQCELKYAPFACQGKSSAELGANEKSLSIALKKSLLPAVCRHEFTNFQIDILIYVLQDDGSVLSAAINCAGLALIDGGIPMYDIITSTTVGVQGDRILLDPTASEEDICKGSSCFNAEHGIVVAARLESHAQTTEFYHIGYILPEKFKKISEYIFSKNEDIAKIVKQALVQKVKEHVVKKGNKDEASN
ncbi:unnamed protein product [Hermetia illucens]|uniref:Exoribonuclease phosphorolytic domain-containing protein n=1 Tax=Hermetia illucens TaxID=343691 RepID=A0A7R8YSR9_HERIL|nr:exosome complex component MTR3 [Hermetia illucens]CAD7080939.1 unnamed protein product [Hermetia illucens]